MKHNKGTSSSKIALYRTFLRCGIRTWEQVIKALRRSNHGDIAEHVELQLLINYSKVINTVIYDLYNASTAKSYG